MSSEVAIPKRKLGKTGLEVTVLGMGGAPLGGLFQVWQLIFAVSLQCHLRCSAINNLSYLQSRLLKALCKIACVQLACHC